MLQDQQAIVEQLIDRTLGDDTDNSTHLRASLLKPCVNYSNFNRAAIACGKCGFNAMTAVRNGAPK